MSSGTLGRRLVACLLNVSEAQRKDLVETVAKAAVYDLHGERREMTTVLNIFNDQDYNRSVITIVASIDNIKREFYHASARLDHRSRRQMFLHLPHQLTLRENLGYQVLSTSKIRLNNILRTAEEAVLSACEKACGLIDMRAHTGVHPCMGSVDLVPIYPLGDDVGVDDCTKAARAVAEGLTERVEGTSAFLFGWADCPLQRGLAQRRKDMGWFNKTADMQAIRPDVGPQPQTRYGLTGVGASPYVMNCNVTIDTQDMALGRSIAAAIRESTPGGLPGVQVLALPHEGAVEIACNVESVKGSPPESTAEPWPTFSIGGEPYCHAPASAITARVSELAGRQGVATKATALVGFTPTECRFLAEGALLNDIAEFWKDQRRMRM